MCLQYLFSTYVTLGRSLCDSQDVSSGLRANARIWFSAEYVSLWGPPPPDADPAADTQVDSPAREPSHPQHQGANFLSFMEHLAHLQQPVSDDDDEDDKIQSEAEMYLELPDEPMHDHGCAQVVGGT